jgi:hypothetical protein
MLANERPLLLRMFRSAVQRSVMANPRGARIRDDPRESPVTDPYAGPERVLSLGEAAARLGASRGELEAMIAAGKVEALPTVKTARSSAKPTAR